MTPGSRAAALIRSWRRDINRRRMLRDIAKLQQKKRPVLRDSVRKRFEAEAEEFLRIHGPFVKVERFRPNPKPRRSHEDTHRT